MVGQTKIKGRMMIIEIYEKGGTMYFQTPDGMEIGLGHIKSSFVDKSVELSDAKIKQLKLLVELGFNSEQIIELKKEGLL